MSVWASLSPTERDEIYHKYARDARPREQVINDLAQAYKIPPLTLSRRLREHRQYFKPGKAPAAPAALPLANPEAPLGKHKTRVLANPTDTHGVYADPYAWELALKCIELLNPDDLVWGNDAMDFGTISSYARIAALPSVRDELDDEKRRREALRSAAPNATFWWLADNHVSERYLRYIFNKAPELAELEELQLHHLLGFPQANMIETFEAGQSLRVIHGAYIRQHPGMSVLQHILNDPANRRGRTLRSVMMGHVHRFAHVSLDNGLEGMECGTLQNLRPEYIKTARRSTNWTHGMGFARYGQDWSTLIPARFQIIGSRLVCRLEGQELSVKITAKYSGFC